ncbi:precorrin-3B synthase [Roseovarius sp. CAU 1744]|uniref:precorrin-3B synthase n=1 Tax=Roseovarius sp. CAU 1744 TaxID=3140368 RepID=UPI00325B291A
MSAPRVYGWCPGALRPMMSGDGLVMRVRAPMGRLTPVQASGIAALSTRHGNGLIDLSARANIQIRGLREEAHPALIDALRGLGLIDRDIAVETRRNLVIQPFWSAGDATQIIAQSLTRALAAPDAPDLPGKFGFAVDCGPTPCLQDTSADIRIEHVEDVLICRADGAETGQPVTENTAAGMALGMARWFLETGGAPGGRGRMAAHIDRIGAPQGHDAQRVTGVTQPKPGKCDRGFLVALEFGQIPAETLDGLAKLGALRLTPWRMVLIEGAAQAPELPGLIADPDDPRLQVTACTGAPGCPQALAATRDIARALAGRAPGDLHVSGCAKGCAHPGPAAHTIVATGGDRFDLIRDGRTTDRPARPGLSLTDLLSGEL